MAKEKLLMKNGLDKNGHQIYAEVEVYKRLPKGWKETKGTLTDPSGYKWIDNNKSIFAKDKKGNHVRKTALLERDWHKKMNEREKQYWHKGHPIIVIDIKGKRNSFGK